MKYETPYMEHMTLEESDVIMTSSGSLNSAIGDGTIIDSNDLDFGSVK